MFIVAKRLMDQDATWYGTKVNHSPGDVVLDGVAAPLKGAQPPSFRSIVAKQLDE